MNLRNAIAWALDHGAGKPIPTADIAALAQVDEATALRYLRWLVNAKVFAKPPVREWASGWTAGAGFLAWTESKPRTRPGGNGKAYRAARAARQAIETRAGTSQALVEGPKLPVQQVRPTSRENAGFLTLAQVAGLLNVSRGTVRNFCRRGRLHPIRYSATLVRYRLEEVLHVAQAS